MSQREDLLVKLHEGNAEAVEAETGILEKDRDAIHLHRDGVRKAKA